MRLFTGISLPESITYALESFLAPLRPLADIRWSPPANFHITTRFIGPWPPHQLPELTTALSTIACPAFDLQLGGLGWFPNAQAPHVLWLGVEACEALHYLASATDAVVSQLGVADDPNPRRPGPAE